MFNYDYIKIARQAKRANMALIKIYKDTNKKGYLVYSGRGRFSYASFDTMNHKTINYKNWRSVHDGIKSFW